MPDLENLLQRLMEHRFEFVIVGGYAAVAHGATMVTQDLDLCAPFTPANLGRLAAGLEGLNPKHRLTPQRLPFVMSDDMLGSLKNLYLETDWGIVDCLGEVLGVGAYPQVLAQSITLKLSFGVCRLLDLGALIQAKIAMNRPHDRLTVLQLEAIRERLKGAS
jgi:hypothetical protein